MNYNLKRPKRIGEEDEDDLLAFQEEFLKSKSEQPAAKVIRVKKEDNAQTNPHKSATEEEEKKQEKDENKPNLKNKVQIDCNF